jgi:hypothetical protein
MPQWLVKPANQVVIAGDPLKLEYEIGANATEADMLPGRVVIFDSTTGTVKESGAKGHGIVGFLDVAPTNLEADNYVRGDEAMVIKGECMAKLTLLAAENVTRGDRLVAAAHGKVAKLAVGAMGAQGDIIGYAEESSNVTVDAKIAVHWRVDAEPATAS